MGIPTKNPQPQVGGVHLTNHPAAKRVRAGSGLSLPEALPGVARGDTERR